MTNARAPQFLRARLDQLAVILSASCLVHCLLGPALIVLLPVLGSTIVADSEFHVWLLMPILPISGIALMLGYARHGRREVWLLGGLGIATLAIGALMFHVLGHEDGHAHSISLAERLWTSAGGLLLAVAHILNYRYCRRVDCTT